METALNRVTDNKIQNRNSNKRFVKFLFLFANVSSLVLLKVHNSGQEYGKRKGGSKRGDDRRGKMASQ
ncbi:hypothetical protein Leryth_010370 [Lithospermum erythrorhizon]|nr:hypothetical protein Leryth_010370 [Lithospermum erythrorhizon]